MCLRRRAVPGRLGRALASAWLLALMVGMARAEPQEVPEQLTVFLDLVVEDGRGRPVRNLTPDEVFISQQGVLQKVAKLVAKDTPGHYELSYVPLSGKAGSVLVQFLRSGVRGRGLDGAALKPRVVQPLSPLESTLTRILEARPTAEDFPVEASVMHFDAMKDGVRHTLALEVPLGGLIVPDAAEPAPLQLQIFARLKEEATGRIVRRFELDRSLPPSTQATVQRLVWTGQARLRSGRYLLEAVAYDPGTARASVRRVPFEASDPAPGLRLGSVALLQPTGGFLVREQGHESDDPFFLGQEPLMPTLGLRTFAAPGVKVDFFTILYPDRTSSDPVTLKVDVLRDGKVVNSAPLPLPAPDERGEIRYAGGLPTRGLEPAEYRLRVHAQQGTVGRLEEVPFTVLGPGAATPVRVGNAPGAASDDKLRASAKPEPPQLTAARRLILRQHYDEAVRELRKMDETVNGRRGDVVLLLAVAYYRLEAYKDAEAALRRTIGLATDDPPLLGQATFLLGRVQAAGEKRPVRKDSERLLAAEESFRRVVAMPAMPAENGHIALAETLIRLDRAGEAQEVLNTLLQKPGVAEDSAARARQLLSSPRCATENCLPPLSYVTADGRHQTAEDLRGKVVLLSFWATWCEPCVTALPELKRVHSANQKGPFIMLGVNLHDDRAAMDRFLEENRITWPQISGAGSERLGEQLAVRGIPTEVLFDHEGVLLSGSVGWRSGSGDALFRDVGRAVGKAKKAAHTASGSVR